MSSHNNKTTTGSLWYWSSATIVVLCLYTALGYGVMCFYPWRPVAMGAPEAIMLEFAEIPTAPDVEQVSETIQQAQVENEPVEEPAPEPDDKPETLRQEKQAVKETPPSDMREEAKQEKPKAEKPKPEIEKPRKKKPPRRRDNVQKAGPTQQQGGPRIAARRGETYKGPATSRNDGDYGRQLASWQRRVAKKIQASASRFDYSGSGQIVYVTFRFDRQGRINSADVTRSSGNDRADSLALKAVKRATPIPAPPEGHKLVLTVPVRLDQGGF